MHHCWKVLKDDMVYNMLTDSTLSVLLEEGLKPLIAPWKHQQVKKDHQLNGPVE